MATRRSSRGYSVLSASLCTLFLLNCALARGAVGGQDNRNVRANMALSDRTLPPLYLKSLTVNAEVNGRIARVTTESVYCNDSSRDLEATYLFPLPDGATVERFVMWMDGEPVEGKVAESYRARSTYEGIVARRKDPGLVEQISENLFRFRIFPVRANSDQKVRLEYSQVLPLSAGGREVKFSYPLYNPAPREDSARTAKSFVASVALQMENLIESIESSTHKISARVLKDTPHKGTVSIEEPFSALDRDFDLRIRLKQQALPVTALAYRPGDAAPAEDGTLMLFITPQLPKGEETAGKDMVLVMDVSGSMEGAKMEQARAALREGLQRLTPKDRFAIVAFSDYARKFREEWSDATAENLTAAGKFVGDLSAAGGTNIADAIQMARSFAGQVGRLRQILFATDGLPTVGTGDTERLVTLAAPPAAGPEAVTTRFFTFGIGYDVNTRLLDRIAEATKGARAYVTERERVDQKLAQLCDKISQPALTDVKIEFAGAMGVGQMYPPVVGDLYVGRQTVITARYHKPGKGQVVIKGKRDGKDVVLEAPLDLPEKTPQATANLPKQWAVRKVGYLLDQMRLHGENAELRDEVVRLGTAFGIVTPYTSYLALERPDRENFDAETKRLEAARVRQRYANATPPQPRQDPAFKLASRQDTMPTDAMTIGTLYPPEALAKTEMGDHFETVNPDRPDTQSAFGNPDVQIFRSVRGNDDTFGGGGNGGTGLEDVIGVGGMANAGNGGGWGGGFGTGTGADTGTGHGSFGQRNGGGRRLMVKRHGGSRATESSVDSALRWLAQHQEADGRWDSAKHGAAQKQDVALTSLALLSFLGAGHTERVGEYKGNVQRAVAWLKARQETNGRVREPSDVTHHATLGAPEALAALALAEAGAMARVPDTYAAAQKAIDYCADVHRVNEGHAQNGWGFTPNSPPNLIATGWFVMALKSAKVAGVHVNPAAFDGVIQFLDSVKKGDEYRYSRDVEQFARPHLLGAIANTCRQFMGWRREELEASVETFIKKGGVPAWGANGESVDLAYWYFGSLCAFQHGGDMWKDWNEALKGALVANQSKQGDDAGSWAPVGLHANDWGRVGQTALACLCLETYYRYLNVQPAGVNASGSSAIPAAPVMPMPPAATVEVPKAESGKAAVDYSEFVRRMMEGGLEE